MQMLLSEKSKAVVLRAVEILETGEVGHCCTALMRAGQLGHGNHPECRMFSKFYGKDSGYAWMENTPANREVRILLLLLFLEACS